MQAWSHLTFPIHIFDMETIATLESCMNLTSGTSVRDEDKSHETVEQNETNEELHNTIFQMKN